MFWILVGISWLCGICAFAIMVFDQREELKVHKISVVDFLITGVLSVCGFIILPLTAVWLFTKRKYTTKPIKPETPDAFEPEEIGYVSSAKEGEPCPNCGIPVGKGGVYCNCNYDKTTYRFNFDCKNN